MNPRHVARKPACQNGNTQEQLACNRLQLPRSNDFQRWCAGWRAYGAVHGRLLYFPGSARIIRSAGGGLFLSFFKPCRNASRRYRALRQMRNDCPGGHDQAVVKLSTRKILRLRFALESLGRPRAPAPNCCASPRDFEGHIPSMLLHPMIPMDLPPGITSAGSVMRLAR
jgi:hypothetical protein